jgi:hypothetical protein
LDTPGEKIQKTQQGTHPSTGQDGLWVVEGDFLQGPNGGFGHVDVFNHQQFFRKGLGDSILHHEAHAGRDLVGDGGEDLGAH